MVFSIGRFVVFVALVVAGVGRSVVVPWGAETVVVEEAAVCCAEYVARCGVGMELVKLDVALAVATSVLAGMLRVDGV